MSLFLVGNAVASDDLLTEVLVDECLKCDDAGEAYVSTRTCRYCATRKRVILAT